MIPYEAFLAKAVHRQLHPVRGCGDKLGLVVKGLVRLVALHVLGTEEIKTVMTAHIQRVVGSFSIINLTWLGGCLV